MRSGLPHPGRVLGDRACPERSRRGGEFDFVPSNLFKNTEVKIPALSLRKPQGQGRGTPGAVPEHDGDHSQL
jgi:hypothetical protein